MDLGAGLAKVRLKGKTGEIPARTRHCNDIVDFRHSGRCHWAYNLGRRRKKSKSGDLPISTTLRPYVELGSVRDRVILYVKGSGHFVSAYSDRVESKHF